MLIYFFRGSSLEPQGHFQCTWWLLLYAGLLIGHGKKVKFRGIFRDKIVEKSADFAGISREYSGQTWPKSNW